jgi:hypothetical protein
MTGGRLRDSKELREILSCCPAGEGGWRAFEEAALATLCHLLVPPLVKPRVQARSFSGLDRRDAVFPNRVMDTNTPWGLLRHDHDARLIPVEFKNYDKEDIGKEETDQTRNYLKSSMGRLAIICCNKSPSRAARLRCNGIYSEEKKIILFVTTADLKEMLDMKDRGDDPSYLIVDYVDQFLIQHE